MRTAIISDIHANLEALQAVREALEEINHDRIICLGDVVGYGANPEECVEIVMGEGWPAIMGNHDAAINDPKYIGLMNPVAQAALEWTVLALSDKSREYLGSLPMTIDLDDNAIGCHGLPFKPEKWVYSDDPNTVLVNFKSTDLDYAFVGHLHYAHAYVYNMADEKLFITRLPESVDLSQPRHLLNVGSVGQPRDEDHRACLVIYDSENKNAVYHRVQYDTVEAARKIVDAGLPDILAQRLLLGS